MILALRDALMMGLIPGPRVFSAGTLITMTGGHVNTISREADGPSEARKAARELIKAGVNFLKVAALGTFFVPTLSVYQAMHSHQNEPTTMEFIRRKTVQVVEASQKAVMIAKAHGVKIGAGTDSGGPWHPHGSIIKEIEALVRAGLTPAESICAATLTNAELLNLHDRIGSLETGKLADFIAVEGNPLENIGTLNKILFIVKDGIPVSINSRYAKEISKSGVTDFII